MSETRTFDLRGDPGAKLQKIKSAAKKKGVTFRGNAKSGVFFMDVDILIKMRVLEGSYSVEGSRISITVTKTPPTYTSEQVWDELRTFVESE